MPFYGDLDWGCHAHAVCVVNDAGQVVARIEARHNEAGLTELLARLRKIAPAAELPIAIERPSGLIVDALIKAVHPVVAIHPNAASNRAVSVQCRHVPSHFVARRHQPPNSPAATTAPQSSLVYSCP